MIAVLPSMIHPKTAVLGRAGGDGINHMGEPMCWYAMSVPYNRVLKVKGMLDTEGIETFVPMRHEIRIVRGKKVRLYIPAVSNLLFVHTTDSRLRLFKQTTTFLQYWYIGWMEFPGRLSYPMCRWSSLYG